MMKVGIIGFGFMGKMHFRCYQAMKNVRIAAICDTEEARLKNTTGIQGNIKGAEKPLDLRGIALYTSLEKMFSETLLDAVSITLPTYLHCEYTLKAFRAGMHVFCEKPMASTVAECQQMITASRKAGKLLQIGHCLRFWPEYDKLKELVDSGRYGRVLSATFQRLSLTPTWSWQNWLLQSAKSGGAALDLHIHDSDYVQYLFGMPRGVFTRGVRGPSRDYDHVVTSYLYSDQKVITAEGGWIMKPGFGFEMSFNVTLEKATVSFDCTRIPTFKIMLEGGKTLTPKLLDGDGYVRELIHWSNRLRGRQMPAVITPQDSMRSVKLIDAEKQSCVSGKTVLLH